jgi:hypothetical protein
VTGPTHTHTFSLPGATLLSKSRVTLALILPAGGACLASLMYPQKKTFRGVSSGDSDVQMIDSSLAIHLSGNRFNMPASSLLKLSVLVEQNFIGNRQVEFVRYTVPVTVVRQREKAGNFVRTKRRTRSALAWPSYVYLLHDDCCSSRVSASVD